MKAFVKNAVLTTLLSVLPGAQIFAQGTAFTYQGRLNAGGAPASGTYDLQFTVYDSAGEATVIAGPLTGPGVSVTNGLFTVSLDFGTSVFTGPARWLQIGVRTNGAASFVPLNPRQALTPAPYAIFAATASNVVSGSVVKSVNALKDDVTLAAGTNVTISRTGNTLTFTAAGPGGSGIWDRSGANTYYNAGNVGIGTSSPAEKLTIAGVSGYNTGLKLTGNTDFGTGLALENTSAGGHKYSFLSGGLSTGVGVGGFGIFDDTIGLYRLAISASGNVGIGTYTPATRLTVNDPNSSYGIEHTDGNVRLATYLFPAIFGRPGGGGLGTISNHKLHFFVNDGDASMTVDTTGSVGIGTREPLTKLHVKGSGFVESAIHSTDERAILALNSTIGGHNRVWTVENGVFGIPGLFGIYDRTAGRAALTIDTQGHVSVGGNVAIGTANTALAKLHVTTSVGNAVEGVTSHRYGVYGRTTRNDPNSAGVYGEWGGPGSTSWSGFFFGPFKIEGNLYGRNADFLGTVTGDVFNERSDRNIKTNFAEVDTRSVFERVLTLPIQSWSFTNHPAIRHVGPMSQDFHAAFKVGRDEKHISTIDVGGVAFAAIQGLNQKLEDELKRRDAENAELKQRVTQLEQLLKTLTERFSGATP